MNETVKQQILEEIKAAGRIVIVRHQRPDGDAVGASLGLREILRDSFPDKEVRCINEDRSEYVAFLGEEDAPLAEDAYADTLVIAVDTGTVDRLANPFALRGRRLIKIDHHVDDKPYGDLSWVEEDRAAASEMIADLCRSFPGTLRLSPVSATCLYAGIVTDTGRFRFSDVSGDTLRLAAMLLEQGIDTETLFSCLEMEEFDYYKFEAYIYGQMQRTESGVVTLHVTSEMQQRFGLSSEQASNTVSLMGRIKNSLIWLAFIDNGDGSTRVRLRSRFVTVRELAARYHGGGHDKASGATVYSREEMEALIQDADALLAEYKRTHEGWL